ncbi:MAG: hypothetical protein JRN22_02210 [Nitrososphaerota archaeon]|nr:hypothetical protein [Nitrososphaerota archaeon]
MASNIKSITIATGFPWYLPMPVTFTTDWLTGELAGFINVVSINHSLFSSNLVISFTTVTPASQGEIEASFLEVFHNALNMPNATVADFQSGQDQSSAPGGVAGAVSSTINSVVKPVVGEANLLLYGALGIVLLIVFMRYVPAKE